MTLSILPVLPNDLTIAVNGTPQILDGKPNKEGTRIWYNGSKVVEQFTDDPAAALRKVTVTMDGEALKLGDDGVHVSDAQKYGPGHAKAGQNKPNTGGNWTVTHSRSVMLVDLRTSKTIRYTVIVTVTYVADKGFVVSAKAIPPGSRSRDELKGDAPAFV